MSSSTSSRRLPRPPVDRWSPLDRRLREGGLSLPRRGCSTRDCRGLCVSPSPLPRCTRTQVGDLGMQPRSECFGRELARRRTRSDTHTRCLSLSSSRRHHDGFLCTGGLLSFRARTPVAAEQSEGAPPASPEWRTTREPGGGGGGERSVQHQRCPRPNTCRPTAKNHRGPLAWMTAAITHYFNHTSI